MDYDTLVADSIKYVIPRVARLSGQESEDYCQNMGGVLDMMKKKESFNFFLSSMAANGKSNVQLTMRQFLFRGLS